MVITPIKIAMHISSGSRGLWKSLVAMIALHTSEKAGMKTIHLYVSNPKFELDDLEY